MTTPQDPPVRNKQKRRRAKQLAAWRAKHPQEAKKGSEKPAEKPAAAKKETSK
jgi:hypothetical protein